MGQRLATSWPIASFRNDIYTKGLNSGPVAQLGARLDGIQEVTGSIPVRSTILPSQYSANMRWIVAPSVVVAMASISRMRALIGSRSSPLMR